jgi:hypothetical protein
MELTELTVKNHVTKKEKKTNINHVKTKKTLI